MAHSFDRNLALAEAWQHVRSCRFNYRHALCESRACRVTGSDALTRIALRDAARYRQAMLAWQRTYASLLGTSARALQLSS
jgi:hypothetical protein